MIDSSGLAVDMRIHSKRKRIASEETSVAQRAGQPLANWYLALLFPTVAPRRTSTSILFLFLLFLCNGDLPENT